MRALRSLLALGAKGALGLATKPSTPAAAQLRLASEIQMERLGGIFGATAANGDTVCLSGDLGAGKTVFSRGFVRAAAGDARLRVTSPTYLLDNAYDDRDGLPEGLVVRHMDLYRLAAVEASAPVYMLDLPDALANACCLIEWPDRLGALPEPRLDVVIRAPGGGDRAVTFDSAPLGDAHPPWLAAIAALADEGPA